MSIARNQLMNDHKLYIVCGCPGAGKTTYGKKLARERNAVFLDIDTSTERLVRKGLELFGEDPDDRDSAAFKKNFRQPIYDQLFAIAKDNLTINDVVITGPFTKEIQIGSWPETISKQVNASVEIHYVYCSPETRRERMIARNNPRDSAKLMSWDSFLKYYGEESPPVFDHVFVDTD